MNETEGRKGGNSKPAGGGGGRIVNTASTTSAASCFASAELTLVAKEVYATLMRVGRSSATGRLNVSRNYDMGNAFEFSQLEKTNNNVITHSKSLLLRDVKPFPDDSRMYALRDVAISLLEKFPNKKDNRGGAVANLIILRDRCTRNHSSRGILNLHLGEEDLAVLGHFDLACAIDQHLEGTSWALGIIELKLNP